MLRNVRSSFGNWLPWANIAFRPYSFATAAFAGCAINVGRIAFFMKLTRCKVYCVRHVRRLGTVSSGCVQFDSVTDNLFYDAERVSQFR
jgi:hypothetical protein